MGSSLPEVFATIALLLSLPLGIVVAGYARTFAQDLRPTISNTVWLQGCRHVSLISGFQELQAVASRTTCSMQQPFPSRTFKKAIAINRTSGALPERYLSCGIFLRITISKLRKSFAQHGNECSSRRLDLH